MDRPPANFSSSPCELHRGCQGVILAPAGISKSKYKHSEHSAGYCCCSVTRDGNTFIPINGTTWEVKSPIEVKGISAFAPLADSFKIAAHAALRDCDGNLIPCRILSPSSTIDGIMFVYDRDYPNPNVDNPIARHFYLTPTRPYEASLYECIGQGRHPDSQWEDCPVFVLLAKGGCGEIDDYIPDPPDDFYLSLCYSALRNTVVDFTICHSDRIEALAALFGVAQIGAWNDLHENASLSEIIHRSLSAQSESGFAAFHHSRKFELRLITETLQVWKEVQLPPH